jgi:hypothetical protein
VRQVADGHHVDAQARRVVAHYVQAVNRLAMNHGTNGLVAVMDLLSWGVRPEVLMCAGDAYAAFARMHNHPPMAVASFFGDGGDWLEYRKGPPKPPPVKSWQPPPGESFSPEELAEVARRLAARNTGKVGTNGATPDSPPPARRDHRGSR